jgi:chromate transporter
MTGEPPARRVPLRTVALEWTRIGITGFGGPPVHVALLRRLVVQRKRWIDEPEFEDAIAACNLLPGPASSQLAIFCARRLAGPLGALIGGLGFIVPSVVAILALSALFLAHAPPAWIRGAGAGAGAAVAAVALHAGVGLLRPSWSRTAHGGAGASVAGNGRSDAGASGSGRAARLRWVLYVALGGAAAALLGSSLVLVLLGCGLAELAARARIGGLLGADGGALALPVAAAATGGIASLAWVAFKVGALSYGGGFVIVPLMQGDAVHTYHWMSSTQFLNAVALGQVTPGPVVATVAAVGYAAHGLAGGLLAAAIAFSPSFAFVLLGWSRFERLRENVRAQSFLQGAGPAAIGAIIGAAIPLTAALHETWQVAVLAAAAAALLFARRGIVTTLVAAGAIGVIVAIAGGPLPR